MSRTLLLRTSWPAPRICPDPKWWNYLVSGRLAFTWKVRNSFVVLYYNISWSVPSKPTINEHRSELRSTVSPAPHCRSARMHHVYAEIIEVSRIVRNCDLVAVPKFITVRLDIRERTGALSNISYWSLYICTLLLDVAVQNLHWNTQSAPMHISYTSAHHRDTHYIEVVHVFAIEIL